MLKCLMVHQESILDIRLLFYGIMQEIGKLVITDFYIVNARALKLLHAYILFAL